MKRLLYLSLYYMLCGYLFAISFIFFRLWKIAILGAFFFLLFLVLRYIFGVKTLPPKLTKAQFWLWNMFLIFSPFLYVILLSAYVWRPYRQAVILPADYRGVVAIQYEKPGGQEKKWTGGFLGMGASRLIQVNTSGVAETQFTYHDTSIKFMGIGQAPNQNKGLKVYFRDNLKRPIPWGQLSTSDPGEGWSYSYTEKQDWPHIYFTGDDAPPLIIFVVTTPSHYYDYFMTEEEKKDLRKREHFKNPDVYYEIYEHELKEEYRHYYDLIKPYQEKLQYPDYDTTDY